MVVCGLCCSLTRIIYPLIQAKVVKVRVLVDHEALSRCRSGDDMSRCVCVFSQGFSLCPFDCSGFPIIGKGGITTSLALRP